ncbi:hypothetical protein HHK36_001728 [Tetracentron sinense]|uniref:Tubby-like F-box protein n=1 Tax=Tetracentron sinense TaxID=13715 RepID=A0A834ZTW6_TETSI|nr:hypothetical protein HHK36_001728 [Tetracentron sinense]
MSVRRVFLSRKGIKRKPFLELGTLNTEETEIKQQQQQHRDLDDGDGDGWSRLLPELLRDIIQRVESSEDHWPARKNVVACACVCKRWRHITREIVGSPLQTAQITFPSSLKQPGPSDFPFQCFVKRNKKNSTFYLYLGLSPQPLTDNGKFLLAARRYRRVAHTEYIISLDADDLSQGSNAYVGKLSSDFLGHNFTIYDSQPPYSGTKPSNSRASRRFASKQISPKVPAGNFETGRISYKLKFIKSKDPRKMLCTLLCPLTGETSDGDSQKNNSEMQSPTVSTARHMVLKNVAPRWLENYNCWCLNFNGRVTLASVKNFQLAATLDPRQPGGKGDEDTVLLQFGMVGEDIFTMDYRQPLSAFQAFAICLTSFGTKLACE